MRWGFTWVCLALLGVHGAPVFAEDIVVRWQHGSGSGYAWVGGSKNESESNSGGLTRSMHTTMVAGRGGFARAYGNTSSTVRGHDGALYNFVSDVLRGSVSLDASADTITRGWPVATPEPAEARASADYMLDFTILERREIILLIDSARGDNRITLEGPGLDLAYDDLAGLAEIKHLLGPGEYRLRAFVNASAETTRAFSDDVMWSDLDIELAIVPEPGLAGWGTCTLALLLRGRPTNLRRNRGDNGSVSRRSGESAAR